MYDRYFDEQDEYTSTEVLRRAYALGVASVCGDPDDEAYERLKRRSPDSYDRSIVELAYEEGRAEALDLEGSVEDGETIWSRLVETTPDPGTDDETDLPEGLPERLSGNAGAGPAAGLPESLDLPSFLRR
jgi:hypothetical protein